MNEVDYSAFFYKREPPDRTEEREKTDTDIPNSQPEKERSKNPLKRRPKGGWKRVLFTLTVLLLLFALTVVVVDFFSGGKLTEKVFSAFRGSDYEYYFVVTDCGKRDYAYAQSLLVREGGGAGYVFTDETCSVGYAVFCDKQKADEVSKKNRNTYVKIVGFSTKNTDFCNAFDGYLRTISASIDGFERGELTEAECYSVLSAVQKEAKERLVEGEKNLSDPEKAVLSYLADSLSSNEWSKGTKVAFLSDLRYLLCAVTYSFYHALA